MARRLKKSAAGVASTPPLPPLPPLPLDAEHWQSIFDTMRLSPQQRTVVDLLLRGCANKEIAARMEVREGTIREYLERISNRTGTRGRVQLAMRVLAVSHQVIGNGKCPPDG